MVNKNMTYKAEEQHNTRAENAIKKIMKKKTMILHRNISESGLFLCNDSK